MSSLNVLYALIAASMVDEEGKDFFTYCEEVSDLALELKCSVASPKGSVVRRLEELDEAVPIKGVLCGIEPSEGKDKRGIITLYTGNEDSEDGTETFRTEWVTNKRGANMVYRARALLGHDVVVFKSNQEMKNRKGSVRICLHIIDHGVNKDWAVSAKDRKGRPMRMAPKN
ncbi:MAG: hypothetical protein E6468_09060 [Varibaculum cambriense]|uniref:hypothetical protein n=1 Tax=Varibaculum cambriense TaxID=184870 RepID=UPI0029143F65|nr:hypothetical protein [Varibaculum cambriense]MDU6681973.1 hypothetical protein [Varibaculum cambriense]